MDASLKSSIGRRCACALARAECRAERASMVTRRAASGVRPTLESDLAIDLIAAESVIDAIGGAFRVIGPGTEVAVTRGTLAARAVQDEFGRVPRDPQAHPALVLNRAGKPVIAPRAELMARFPAIAPTLALLAGGPLMLVPVKPSPDADALMALELAPGHVIRQIDEDLAAVLMEESARRLHLRARVLQPLQMGDWTLRRGAH